MKKILPFIFVFMMIANGGLFGQNLVPNGGFEEYTRCPTYLTQIDSCKFWFNPAIPTLGGGSPDYFNHCSSNMGYIVGIPKNTFGVQETHNGNGYAGFCIYNSPSNPNFREYIEVPLKIFLEHNCCYHIIMHLNLANICKLSSINIGVYFSDTLIAGINNPYPLPFTPQFSNTFSALPDTLHWTLIEGNFIAQGGEKFLIIGNFKNDTSTNTILINPSGTELLVYLYIDDVYLYKCDTPVYTANAAGNKTICKGESAQIGMPQYGDYQFKWYSLDGILIDTTNYLTVSPDATTSYILWVEDFKYDITTDTVTVFVEDDCGSTIYIPNIFSPNNDNQNDKLYVRGEKIQSLHLYIYNRWGNKVFETEDITQGWDGTQNNKPCETGVYIYRAEVTFKNGESIVKRGDVRLVR